MDLFLKETIVDRIEIKSDLVRNQSEDYNCTTAVTVVVIDIAVVSGI